MYVRVAAFSWSIVKWTFIALGVALAVNALTYLNFDADYKFLRLKREAIATGWYLPFYYSHVLISAFILVAGFFQVSKLSQRFLKLHRFFGYVYVMGILFLAAPGGFVMSLFIGRGPWVLASFITQGILWFVCTAIAFSKIRHGDIESHREWMWRSFAITVAAITLRLYILFLNGSADLSQQAGYATLAWLSWVPNLIVAEVVIVRGRRVK